MHQSFTWHKITDPGELLLAECEVIELTVPDKTFCLTKVDGSLFAFQAKCPHAGALLSGGIIKSNCIICPLHGYTFDVKTGINKSGEGFRLLRYPIKEDENGVWVGIPILF